VDCISLACLVENLVRFDTPYVPCMTVQVLKWNDTIEITTSQVASTFAISPRISGFGPTFKVKPAARLLLSSPIIVIASMSNWALSTLAHGCQIIAFECDSNTKWTRIEDNAARKVYFVMFCSCASSVWSVLDQIVCKDKTEKDMLEWYNVFSRIAR